MTVSQKNKVRHVSEVIRQESPSPSCHPRRRECIPPPRAMAGTFAGGRFVTMGRRTAFKSALFHVDLDPI